MLKTVSVAFSILVLVFLAGSVGAVSNIELAVSPTAITSCSDRVLTSSDIQVSVKNLLPKTDTISLSVTWIPNGFSAFIRPEVTVASGEQAKVDTIFINVPYTLKAGTYTATVKAVSQSTGETVSKDISITVLACRAVSIAAAEPVKSVCREDGVSVSYALDISNIGKYDEIVTLSASQSGQAVGWAVFSENNIVLRSGAGKSITLTLAPPQGVSGPQIVSIEARSPESYVTGSGSVTLNIEKCYDFSVQVSPGAVSGCAGLPMVTELTITNTGKKTDTYAVTAPSGTVSLGSVSLGAGMSEKIKVTFTPQAAGQTSQEISVTSSVTNTKKAATLAVDAKECRSVALMVSPSIQTACKNTPGVYVVSVKNTGPIRDTFVISATIGSLSESSVTLEPNEVKAINLQVDTKDIEAGKTVQITVKATDGVVSQQATVELSVMVCYAAELSLTPETVSICPKATTGFTATVKNTGIKPDTYDIGFIFNNLTYPGVKGANIIAGNSQTFNLTLPIPQIAGGTYNLYATAISPYISLTDTATVTIKPMEVCYSVGLQVGDGSRTIQTSKATVVPVMVKNTGEISQKFNLTITGPGWIYLSPRELSLAGGKEDKVYLYISPPYTTLAGDYKASITAESENSKAESSVSVSVLSEITAPQNVTITPAPVNVTPTVPNVTAPLAEANITPPAENVTAPPENVTAPPAEENISVVVLNQTIPTMILNVTTGNITGLLTGLPLSWKTVAVIVIGIIIVIILIVRFALLLK